MSCGHGDIARYHARLDMLTLALPIDARVRLVVVSKGAMPAQGRERGRRWQSWWGRSRCADEKRVSCSTLLCVHCCAFSARIGR